MLTNIPLFKIGVIGLGKMGSALAKLLMQADQRLALYDPSTTYKSNPNSDEAHKFCYYSSIQEFCKYLAPKCTVLVCVPAGPSIDELMDYLKKQGVNELTIVDVGNSFFEDSIRRASHLKASNIKFVDVGISGGVNIAESGACIMVGGEFSDIQDIASILDAISCEVVGDRSTQRQLGSAGAGHFVKMVHNGIEYAWLQLWCEFIYYQMNVNGLSARTCANQIVSTKDKLYSSFIGDITAAVLLEEIADGIPLINRVSEVCDSNGTGALSVATAMRYGVPCSTLAAAVEARNLGSTRELYFKHPCNGNLMNTAALPHREAVFSFSQLALAVVLSQGLMMVSAISEEYGWQVDLKNVLGLWSRGSIIRGNLIDHVYTKISSNESQSPSVYHDFLYELPQLRAMVNAANSRGYPMPCHVAALSFIDSISVSGLWTPLLAAQRDYFGGHGFRMRGSSELLRWNWSKC